MRLNLINLENVVGIYPAVNTRPTNIADWIQFSCI